MATTDIFVVLVIIIGTSTFTILLWRQSIRGRSLFSAAWLSFYGLVLTASMLAHSVEVVYRAVARRAGGADFASTYNFRLYSLLLLAALLIWAGVQCLRAAPRLGRGSAEARQDSVRASVVVLAIVAPLIPIQTVFGTLFTVVSIFSLMVLTWGLPAPKRVPPEALRTLRCLITIFGIVLPSSIAAQKSSPADRSSRPNVIVFFMDDLGYGDLRAYGATDVQTPNLDRLAREGVRLTACYAAAPVCTPTRAAFMTGAYQHRVGLESVLTARNNQLGLSASVPTLPRLLKNAGYATGLVGKWHLGWKPEFHPNRHGFDEFFGFLSSSVDYYSHRNSSGAHDLYENERPVELKTYLTDEITARAISFIERHASTPFFLDVAYNATHWPFHPPDLTPPPAQPAGTPEEVSEQWAAQGTRKDYVRMLERADLGIGRVLAALERAGLRDRTLVIFTSDNGGEWLSRMGPFFNRKGTLWEGGLRVPCIVRWPGQLPAGTVSSQAAITMDLTATILAAARVDAPPARPLDGIDLTPILAGKTRPIDRTFYWISPVAGSPDKAIRSGRWKYISQSALFPGLLFDLPADPGERHDLAAERPDLIKRLRGMHRDWEGSVRKPPSPGR